MCYLIHIQHQYELITSLIIVTSVWKCRNTVLRVKLATIVSQFSANFQCQFTRRELVSSQVYRYSLFSCIGYINLSTASPSTLYPCRPHIAISPPSHHTPLHPTPPSPCSSHTPRTSTSSQKQRELCQNRIHIRSINQRKMLTVNFATEPPMTNACSVRCVNYTLIYTVRKYLRTY